MYDSAHAIRTSSVSINEMNMDGWIALMIAIRWHNRFFYRNSMSAEEQQVSIENQEVEVAVEAPAGQMSVEDALQEVLRRALVHDGLARGLKEAVKALDR